MTPRRALAFVRKHGVVLEAGRGPAPSLAEFVAGAPIRGSWWPHAKGREIFAISRFIRERDDILVCRLLLGKITFVHQRLWPALVRVAEHFPPERLARLREVHTPSGRHVVENVPFPQWVPSSIRAAGGTLSLRAALAAFSRWVEVETTDNQRARLDKNA